MRIQAAQIEVSEKWLEELSKHDFHSRGAASKRPGLSVLVKRNASTMLSTKKRNHQEFKISSRLEEMMKPQEPKPTPAQPEEEKKDDAVHVASNSTSRVNGAWGPFGFRRDATNYKMTQPSSNPNQTPST